MCFKGTLGQITFCSLQTVIQYYLLVTGQVKFEWFTTIGTSVSTITLIRGMYLYNWGRACPKFPSKAPYAGEGSDEDLQDEV